MGPFVLFSDNPESNISSETLTLHGLSCQRYIKSSRLFVNTSILLTTVHPFALWSLTPPGLPLCPLRSKQWNQTLDSASGLMWWSTASLTLCLSSLFELLLQQQCRLKAEKAPTAVLWTDEFWDTFCFVAECKGGTGMSEVLFFKETTDLLQWLLSVRKAKSHCVNTTHVNENKLLNGNLTQQK